MLGRHRDDDARTGWISGLDGARGRGAPDRGGLRIGKPLPERGPDEPLRRAAGVGARRPVLPLSDQVDARARSGDAVDRASRRSTSGRASSRTRRTAPSRTCRAGAARRRMYWKLSIDLSRPLVTSMGQHDPLDGLVTCVEPEASAAGLAADAGPHLERRGRGLRRDDRPARPAPRPIRSASAACSSTPIARRSSRSRAAAHASRLRRVAARCRAARPPPVPGAARPPRARGASAGLPRARPGDRSARGRSRRGRMASATGGVRARVEALARDGAVCAPRSRPSGCGREHAPGRQLARSTRTSTT